MCGFLFIKTDNKSYLLYKRWPLAWNLGWWL